MDYLKTILPYGEDVSLSLHKLLPHKLFGPLSADLNHYLICESGNFKLNIDGLETSQSSETLMYILIPKGTIYTITNRESTLEFFLIKV